MGTNKHKELLLQEKHEMKQTWDIFPEMKEGQNL